MRLKSISLCPVPRIVLLITVLAVPHVRCGDSGDSGREPEKRLRSTDANMQATGARRVLQAHEEVVTELIKVASTRNDELNPCLAIKLLGKLRATAAIDALIDRIDAVYDMDVSTTVTIGPCGDALIRIGKPASQKCIAALGAETDERRKRLLVEVIRGVEGDKFGKMMVQDAAENEPDPKKRERLLGAVDLFR